ncbi:hypothetical protein EDB89DRAFT_1622849 [Lactarius sanguifluus]|nr:hypothetical protein EDB89DRAFT_1622849 [Lactarius sanguifluus]
MPGSEDRDSSQASSSEPASLEALPPDLAASGQDDEHGDDRSVDVGVKLTVYKLLEVVSIFIGITKCILSYKGQSIAPTTLELVVVVLMGVLYFFRLFEEQYPQNLFFRCFFQIDLVPPIGYCIKRVAGGFLWLLFFTNGFFPLAFLGLLLVGLAHGLILNRSASIVVAIVAAVTCVAIIEAVLLSLWYCVGVLRERAQQQAWVWQGATKFVGDYAPSAPPEKGYEWFAMVGTVVGLVFGIILLLLPPAGSIIYSIRSCKACRENLEEGF